MPLISAQNISKVFGRSHDRVTALDNVSLDIAGGEFLAIMGPSGSGKTTLLTVLGAMNAPSQGQVIIDGVSLYSLSAEELADFRARRLGFVFQQLHLIPYLTVIENVMLPLAISQGHDDGPEVAWNILGQVGLESKALRLPGQLSSGEQARVAIARAMVKTPPIILADEPTGNLDSRTGQDVMHLLQALNQQGRTIIMVTHNQEAAKAARKRIYLRDGRITGSDG